MWPDSLHLLTLDGSWHWWVERGLGGIGVAQQYLEPVCYLAGDNLFVYVVVSLGLPLVLLLFVAWWWRVVQMVSQGGGGGWHLPVFLILAAYGVVMSVMELDVLGFFAGILLTSLSRVANPACDSDKQ